MDEQAQIAAPVAKAASAIGAGLGTSAMSLSATAQGAGNFLPTDLGGWLACGASAAALIYSVTLLGEWWWKKFWRPRLEQWGWVQPHARRT
jgi:hypothetical protein